MSMAEILVATCPSGKQCVQPLPLIYGKGKYKLRLAAHSDASMQKLKTKYPDAEVIQGDIANLNTCRKLVQGATTIFHVGPSLHSREKEMGFNMIDAAVEEIRRPGNVFKHFVFSSVLGTQHRKLMQHDLKSYVEERLMLSPLNWTILKPTNFMDAYPVALFAQQERPVMQRLWNANNANSLVALRDIADAVAKVLNEREKHYFGEYPLCSTMPISDADVAKVIGKKIGKEIEVRSPTFEQGISKLLAATYQRATWETARFVGGEKARGDETANEGEVRQDIAHDEAERLILFYNRRGLKGSPNVLGWLLGRARYKTCRGYDRLT